MAKFKLKFVLSGIDSGEAEFKLKFCRCAFPLGKRGHTKADTPGARPPVVPSRHPWAHQYLHVELCKGATRYFRRRRAVRRGCLPKRRSVGVSSAGPTSASGPAAGVGIESLGTRDRRRAAGKSITTVRAPTSMSRRVRRHPRGGAHSRVALGAARAVTHRCIHRGSMPLLTRLAVDYQLSHGPLGACAHTLAPPRDPVGAPSPSTLPPLGCGGRARAACTSAASSWQDCPAEPAGGRALLSAARQVRAHTHAYPRPRCERPMRLMSATRRLAPARPLASTN